MAIEENQLYEFLYDWLTRIYVKPDFMSASPDADFEMQQGELILVLERLVFEEDENSRGFALWHKVLYKGKVFLDLFFFWFTLSHRKSRKNIFEES